MGPLIKSLKYFSRLYFRNEKISNKINFTFTMCSVLQSPIPSAPLFLAVSASAGVSAFAITYYRTQSEHPIILQGPLVIDPTHSHSPQACWL